jgi:hypothetical protein
MIIQILTCAVCGLNATIGTLPETMIDLIHDDVDLHRLVVINDEGVRTVEVKVR